MIGPIALAALAGLSSAQAQQTQGFDAHGFQLVAHDGDIRDGLAVQRPGPFTAGDMFASGLLEYAKSPLVQVIAAENGGEAGTNTVLDHVTALNISAGVAAHERLRFDVKAPAYLTTTGLQADALRADEFTQGPTFGDIRLTAMAVGVRPRYVQGSPGGVGFGGVLYTDLPSGNTDRFLGQAGVAGGGRLAVTYEADRATLSADAGMQFNPSIALSNLQNTDNITMGAHTGILVSDTTSLNVELVAAPPLEPNEIQGASFPAEAIGHVKTRPPSGLFVTVGGAGGLTQGAGVATFRAFLGMGYARIQPPRAREFDHIGAFASRDECPLEFEVFNDWKDDDGCPDDIGRLAVDARYNDEPMDAEVTIVGPDGTKTVPMMKQGMTFDAYPETSWNFEATAQGGCLHGLGHTVAKEGGTQLTIDLKRRLEARVTVIVTDAQGAIVPTAAIVWTGENEACLPDEPEGTVDELGMWSTEVGQGTFGLAVVAPGYNPFELTPIQLVRGSDETIEVMLNPSKVIIEKKRIRITDKVHFEFNKAVIKEDSFGLLDEVAHIIMDHPDVGRIEVGGHTDSKGGDNYNMRLSQKRADAVRKFLEDKGVNPERLQSKGYGETKPIDTNRTQEGRDANRRVEFLLIDQEEEEEASDPSEIGDKIEKEAPK